MSADLTLEPITARHAADVQRLASHPDVVATTNLPEPYPDDGAEQWIEHVQARRKAGDEYAFGIRNEGIDGRTKIGRSDGPP